ncbi:hypothetical protein HJC99_02755 [Candidatus Saccharibacteria bacterium]|nr:hypothetical protein [Candidatus Saccharibacteria bacterium]
MTWNHTTGETLTAADVASFFGHRAGGLFHSTTDALAAAQLAPICVTASFAKETGMITTIDGEESFPAIDDPNEVPDSVHLDWSARSNGYALVIRGELGGASDNDEYMLINVDALTVGAVIHRVSCNGTTHRFTRTDAGYAYLRVEAPNLV